MLWVFASPVDALAMCLHDLDIPTALMEAALRESDWRRLPHDRRRYLSTAPESLARRQVNCLWLESVRSAVRGVKRANVLDTDLAPCYVDARKLYDMVLCGGVAAGRSPYASNHCCALLATSSSDRCLDTTLMLAVPLLSASARGQSPWGPFVTKEVGYGRVPTYFCRFSHC